MTESLCSPESISERIAAVRDDIRRYSPYPDSVRLMAVTKTRTAEEVNIAAAGVDLCGENRAQELRDRFESYAFGAEKIHFIGALQTNKLKYIIGRACCVESINSLELAQALSERCLAAGTRMDVCIEVNVGAEDTKSGIDLAALLPLLEKLSPLPGISVRGLMCIPPPETVPGGNRRYFSQMHNLFVDIAEKKLDNINMELLSMGMSGDYISALQEGANIIRIGAGIFGARVYKGGR